MKPLPKTLITLTPLLVLFVACADKTTSDEKMKKEISKSSYLQNLENDNNISYENIINSRGVYITSMCYTKTEDKSTEKISNPCYSCHTKGKEPNYYNDSTLQKEYNFPPSLMKNPYSNLFKDRSSEVEAISDADILEYIQKSNYFDSDGEIILADSLPHEWNGYRPDCHFNFDDEGFDRDENNDYTLWRAFRYYPFLGTFWPTNGSTDDVMIRLEESFSQNAELAFDKETYTINLAIVEALVKQEDVNLSFGVDENKYGVDLNQNGTLDTATQIVLASYDRLSYVGEAKEKLQNGELHLALGLFPENTEFLHSVRYLDWNEQTEEVQLSARMKELRYAKKQSWKTYSEIQRVASAELWESQANGSNEAVMSNFRGNYEEGLNNELGWIYQGFIEDKNGALRPQTHEETIGCMGCHSHLGATTDSIFAFARKFKGSDKTQNDYGWNHWTQKGLNNIKEPIVPYKNLGEKYEYSFYLQNNHSANEFRNNDEVKEKFFDTNGSIKQDMQNALHDDISLLLLPSKIRALTLDKAYRVMVTEQSYIFGRDANAQPMSNVFQEIQEGSDTHINTVIVR